MTNKFTSKEVKQKIAGEKKKERKKDEGGLNSHKLSNYRASIIFLSSNFRRIKLGRNSLFVLASTQND